MKFSKGPNGIIGKTTKPGTLQIWAKSQHLCSEVLQSLDSIREIHEIRMTTHKEEKDGRMKADLIDKVKLHETFLKHACTLSIVETTQRVLFETFILMNCQVLK